MVILLLCIMVILGILSIIFDSKKKEDPELINAIHASKTTKIILKR